jgi:hypothetical protein
VAVAPLVRGEPAARRVVRERPISATTA